MKVLIIFFILITAIIKLVWDIFGESLAKMLGYITAKVLHVCHEANDHHKAFQFVEILLFGTGI